VAVVLDLLEPDRIDPDLPAEGLDLVADPLHSVEEAEPDPE
jgi:hypothetical protein